MCNPRFVFSGLDGVFDGPPAIRDEGGTLLAFDSERVFEVHADRFGITLCKREFGKAGLLGKSSGKMSVRKDGTISGSHAPEISKLKNVKECVLIGSTLALTTTDSHRIRVFALTRGEPRR